MSKISFMKKIICSFLFGYLSLVQISFAQTSVWLEADRKYLLEQMMRSRDEVLTEMKGLTLAQWNFKETKDRWSIKQVVEHIAIWEMLLQHEISNSFEAGPQPERVKTAEPDSISLNFIMDTKPHHSLDYTKPFSYTIPMGLNTGKSNIAWLLKMRNESISYLSTTKDDLRIYFNAYANIHQLFIYIFGHADRHIRQIRKIKKATNYPVK